MKYYFTLNGKRISSYSEFPMITQENEIQYEIETDIDFYKIKNCDYINGELIYNSDYEVETIISNLRMKRNKICFTVVNRGQVWYNTLTTEQLVELQTWYQSWLDAPQTLIEPETPYWINLGQN